MDILLYIQSVSFVLYYLVHQYRIDCITFFFILERYCPLSDSWEKIASMNKFRSAGGGASLRGCVWALGGHDGLSIFDSVERFDPRVGTWEKQKPMLSKRFNNAFIMF